MSKKKSRNKRVGPPKTRNTAGLIPWKPGQSGNPKGRPKSITLSEAYRHKLGETFPGKDHTWAEEIAERMAKLALSRVTAATEMADRTEGKAPQFMQLGGGGSSEAPIFHVNFMSGREHSEELPQPVNQLEPIQVDAIPLVNQSENTGGEV